MTETRASMELDPSQLAVVEADADARLLVTAGAGQGKTEVVAGRVAHLVEEEALSASTEIMVLSFSRAAVHAVRSRLEARDIAKTDVRTFDSLASHLLAQNDIEPTGDFDHRIRQAIRLLDDDSTDVEGLEDIAHVILDEVQDLVGDRADMVLGLLGRLGADVGFTALGDPLQGIYDFTLADSHSKTSSAEFMEQLAIRFGARRVELEKNYRARGAFPLGVIDLGLRIRDEVEGPADEIISTFERTLPHSGTITEWRFLEQYTTGVTAILCNSNAEVLLVSRSLTTQDISHVVRRPAQDFGAARWVGEVFEGLAGPDVARSTVEAAIEKRLPADLRDEAWYLLKGAEGKSRSPNQLSLQRLRSLIAAGTVPLTLVERDTSRVIVSTIHRAKGLEFERAFLVHPNYTFEEESEWPAIRRMYVALSRARDDVAVIDIPDDRTWFKNVRGRMCEMRRGKNNNYVRAMELTARDVRDDSPPPMEPHRLVEMQRNLAAVSPGEAVTGFFDPTSTMSAQEPVFVLSTGSGELLGVTDRRLGRHLSYNFGYRFRDGWDGATLEDLTLVSIDTVATDPRSTAQAGLGDSGLWLVPRVFGLVTPAQG
ncbi:DNA helicase IV (plasmid) [Tsukamurella tyrosinosolvens]|uniref:UvrD-like helicase C-terminal domain-containing protein n=1 Tax=Tsukamurella tyrosinosolvens TaxID=57704 RepID=A0A1H4R885_TSUTY|nr:UvrD-helicase domain-containing protein [Tsukamurella tyrosinosolvens]KXO91393.1 helicase [Tsukamurella tyrosinosolvens]SEC28109.1 UvrD-like helicase C-terminal domain-containing protein [Tsukamurella tyrosinosolvens]VEH92218.1 DNA helicase IV [Tsukamurella tyrosinosolvens]